VAIMLRVGWDGAGLQIVSTKAANSRFTFSSSLTEWRSRRRPAEQLVGNLSIVHSWTFRSSSSSALSMREGKRLAALECARASVVEALVRIV